ncbi:hypothetical protein [Pedobacter aquatilis]|uniref:hypothetical protein n=1 Tax=Pedobacter aquatilis TaxID=351343 RepID=UPI00292F9425|nr:hypothetical protein [Pedobacter aquatilis]
MIKEKISLQINLSPGDYPSARLILVHQLNALAKQVDEIVIVVESKPSKGRFSEGWSENKVKLDTFLSTIEINFSARVIYVNYDEIIKSKVADYFFGKRFIPEKDFRGGPFYCYFFGMYNCSNDIILHLDADMFLGGRSDTWISEATELYNNNKNLFCVAPLPGPPANDECLIGQTIIKKFDEEPYKFQLEGFSTRIFMIKKSLVHKYKLHLTKPGLKNQIKAILNGNNNADLPEHLIADFMLKNDLIRIDFLGKHQGMWSLHPPYRNEYFHKSLKNLISRIESNEIPEVQRGFYDIVDELIDWSDARKKLKSKLFKFRN